MKSQILPPALCLIMVILCCFTHTFSSAKNVNLKTNLAGKHATMFILDANYLDYFITTNGPTRRTKISNSAILSASDSNSSITKKQSLHEVISYESASIIATGNVDYQNIGDISLFRKGMFYGFAVMVILLNFICFLLFEEKIFLFFSLALTALSPTFLSIDSLFPLLGINGIENIGAMQSAMFFISTVFGALFASKFLTLEEFYPKLKWVAASILGFSLMTIFTSWISASAFYSSVANIANFSVLALYFLAGITLFSKKKYAKFYVIALAIPLLFSLDFFVFKELGIYFLSTGNSHLRAATIVEMILMTFAIIYRMRAIKEEHEMRQTEMHIFLKRQEVLNRANTQELMQDIHLENLIMNYDLDGLEIKLLQYISEGKDNSKIAQKLNTTEREIELYTKGLYHKLEIEEHVKDDYQMVASQADYIYN
jgi:DNA-binding CsgD family transcriptional regulator